jgi:uncharacterized phage protein gp47/JayE
MIERVQTMDPNLDTREGSIIYNALAPCALELKNMMMQLDAILNETFADTATRPYLIQRAAERGFKPHEATPARVQGEFNIDVPIGSEFSLLDTDLDYRVIAKIADGIYSLECLTPGAAANDKTGRLLPNGYISGLGRAEITAILTPGRDEEETELFRKRYFDSLDAEAFGGNVKDYKNKISALPGVGGVKVYPVWAGGGTVRIAIIGSDFAPPSGSFIAEVQEAVDPVPYGGQGMGTAPIGHVVTVTGAAGVTVDIATSITYESGWDWANVKPYAESATDEYMMELAKSWADTSQIVVRISQIETRFLGLPGVLDIADTTLNGTAQNLTLGTDEIPQRGDIVG